MAVTLRKGSKIYWQSIDSAVKFWVMKCGGNVNGKHQIVQKGANLGSLESSDGDKSTNDEDYKVKSKVIKLQHNEQGGKITFARSGVNNLETNQRRRRMDTFHVDVQPTIVPTVRPRFDRFHWYRNDNDMERGFGELRRRFPTPKKFRRKLNF